jgi:penicillin amidase
MRITPFIISAVLTILLIVALNTRWGRIPAMGDFFSPQHGFWQNAEPVAQDISFSMQSPFISGEGSVCFDERMVPHVFTKNENDAYFIEGFLHAKFRLWQMDIQTRAAAGRLSEVFGDKFVNHDREQRRLGMVYAAEILLKEMESNPITKSQCDRYTAGVNAYIESLTLAAMPLEYKLLGYKPEKWTNLKIALFIKQMAKTLASAEDDLLNTAARKVFSDAQLEALFPQIPDSLDPVIPKQTSFPAATVKPLAPAGSDSAYLGRAVDSIPFKLPPKSKNDNGSNNWAVSGAKTLNGAAILANDPHLDLTLPSIWFEIQLSTENFNTYGVSFPGVPGIVIGFNNNIAWGVTDSRRDVRDYYEIRFKDHSKKMYWFNNQWRDVEQRRIEEIKIKDHRSVFDTVAYTVFGPVMYDDRFGNDIDNSKAYAVRWTAHDPSNELLVFNKLNHARNYDEFVKAISTYYCPGQNFVFASATNDIAIWQQGGFPARWNRQGLYVMPGLDTSYMWQGMIPSSENPNMMNPARGFVSSANQRGADSAYPYFIPGAYSAYRGMTINRKLSEMSGITPEMMMELQNDNFNAFAETMRPLLMRNTDQNGFTGNESKYFDLFSSWDLKNDTGQKGMSIFKIWIDSLSSAVWDDEFAVLGKKELFPSHQTLAESLLRDSLYSYIDNINTPGKESLKDIVTASFKRSVPAFVELEKNERLEWEKFKHTSIAHLLRLSAFARNGLPVGGGADVINAAGPAHGPSWKMVVQLSAVQPEAWVIYPGGQSGNPGSLYYDNFVDDWAAGRHYKAWFMRAPEEKSKKIKAVFHFQRGI